MSELTTAAKSPQNELDRYARHLVRPIPPSILFRIRPSSVYKANGDEKQAILAKVSVKKQSSDSVAVRLESDELSDATVIVSPVGIAKRTRIKRPGCRLDVTCKGDPRAEVGNTVPLVVESEPGN